MIRVKVAWLRAGAGWPRSPHWRRVHRAQACKATKVAGPGAAGQELTCVWLAAFLSGAQRAWLDCLSLLLYWQGLGGPGQHVRARHLQGHNAVYSFGLGVHPSPILSGGCQQDQFGELSGLRGGSRDHICAWLRGLGGRLLGGSHALPLLLPGLGQGHSETDGPSPRSHAGPSRWVSPPLPRQGTSQSWVSVLREEAKSHQQRLPWAWDSGRRIWGGSWGRRGCPRTPGAERLEAGEGPEWGYRTQAHASARPHPPLAALGPAPPRFKPHSPSLKQTKHRFSRSCWGSQRTDHCEVLPIQAGDAEPGAKRLHGFAV